MGWWSSLKENASALGNGVANGVRWLWTHASVDNAKAAGTGVVNGANWLRNNATLGAISNAAFKFTVNTTFHVLEQVLALKKAVPTLVYNKDARQIVNGFTKIVVRDVLPIVALNVANNQVQKYANDGYDEDESSAAYSLFVNMLSIGSYIVVAYSVRRGSESVARVLALDSFAPAAFNSNKSKMPPSLCDTYECNTQRRLKGLGRELGILLANEAIIWGISYTPYIGSSASTVLTVVNNGRYITRTVTPERCERHKYMEQEFVLALGLTYELASWLLDKGLESTVGPIPYLYLRTLRHILLAFSINLAAHMAVPLVLPKDATIPDPFHYYERAWRFLIDVFWAGLLVRVPIDFKPQPGEQPLIPLATTLQAGTSVFQSDLERIDAGKSHPVVRAMKDLVIPPMFRSSYQFPQDPILAQYWPAIRGGALAVFTGIEVHGKSKKVEVLTWGPSTAAFILNYQLGVPETLTKIAILLSKEKDFWRLTRAIKTWIERHPSTMVDLVEKPKAPLLALLGDKPQVRRADSLVSSEEVVPAQQLISEKANATGNSLTPINQLRSKRKEERDETAIDKLIPDRRPAETGSHPENPMRFMSTRRKKALPSVKIEELPDSPSLVYH